MPRTRLAYPKEFRQKIIELARSGRSIVELTREFEPSEQTIRNWIRQADINAGHRHDGLSSEEKQELSRLRKENRRLQQERDILAKAAAWFARERSEEHTSELQSRGHLVCRLLLEKKNIEQTKLA